MHGLKKKERKKEKPLDGDFVACESGEDGAHMSGKRRDECCKQQDEAY